LERRKGFTLIELMVVIFIAALLAAVAIPIMRGRIDAAKWAEGKDAAGSIRTAARAFCAEKGPDWTGRWNQVTLTDLGFNITPGAGGGDLDGKYFTDEAYSIQITAYNRYTIMVRAGRSLSPEAPLSPGRISLNQDGVLIETP
jgi:type IV pilus assembly protein PilA